MDITALQRKVNAADIPPEKLAGNTHLTERQKIAEASRQFEAILLRQILESSQKNVIKTKYTDNSTSSSIYRDLVTNQLADCVSKAGTFGLAKVFEQQLSRPAAGERLSRSAGGGSHAGLNSKTSASGIRRSSGFHSSRLQADNS